MAGAEQIEVPRVKLGSQGLEVSVLGFGCMGLSGTYNAPLPEEDGIAILKEAFHRGVTFFDTSDVYGVEHANEYLVGKALKQLPREKVQLATKFGICRIESTHVKVKGTPEYARSCCEGSLKRLQVDYIDLYYVHRIDTTVPIEETMGELKKLVEEGKIMYIGLSESNADTIRRAHAVHPITAIQMEYSLWTREIEQEIIPLCRELGIGIVPYSPVGRGLFAGKAVVESLPHNSYLVTHPRFTGENLEKNKQIYYRLESLSKKHGCSPVQLALAWVLHQGNDIVPIPGTTKIKNLHENIGSVKLRLKLKEEDIKEITDAAPINEVAGQRNNDAIYRTSYCNNEQREMPKVKLGGQGLEVSRLGFGCMGLSGVYNDPLPEEEGIAVIEEAFKKGITFFDTSDSYGINHANEYLLGKALKLVNREKIQVATKFGIYKIDFGKVIVKGTPEYVRSSCEASLKRLDVDYIDLYYIHRIDTTIPIEETMSELKKLVEEGKIKYVGLSEASPDTIRRAHAVHPITALQTEYSLWTREIEEEIIPLCRELGIAIVPYSPIGRGFFGGKAIKESLAPSSFLNMHPRLIGDNFEKNKKLYFCVESLAQKYNCTTPQLALAWVLHQGDDVVPIPGTTKIKNLNDNCDSIKVKLTKEDVEKITEAVPLNEVAGNSVNDFFLCTNWQFTNTPPFKA